MDKSFLAVTNTFKAMPKLSHKAEVMRIYRRALRLTNSWSESRDVFNAEAIKIRKQFDQNKNIPAESPKARRLIREAQEKLVEQTHPDPYIQPYMPGGSLFMRNPAIPLEALFPDGIPEGISNRRINIDMSNIPDDQPYADKCFVDSANKVYWIEK